MLFSPQKLTLHISGDDHVGVPLLDPTMAMLAFEAIAKSGADIKAMMDSCRIVPHIHNDGTECACVGPCRG